MPNCESCFCASNTKIARWIVGLETVRRRQRIPNRLLHLVVVQPQRVHPDAVEIVVVLEHIHGVVRNVDDPVVVVVALLHAWRSHADHFKRHAVDANGLSDCRHAGEKFLARFRSDHGIESVLHVVGIVQKPAFGNVEIPYLLDRRIESHHRKRKRAVIVLHRGIFLRMRTTWRQSGTLLRSSSMSSLVKRTGRRPYCPPLAARCVRGRLPPQLRRSSQKWSQWLSRSRCRRRAAALRWQCPTPFPPW
jgi:hypothetical protein